jgi:hypothetical protein
MSVTTRAPAHGLVAFFILMALCAGPAAAADPPHLDCGKGLEAVFCPLKVPGFIVEGRVFLASEFMERGERIAYATLDGINFYGQLVGEMADRVVLTEGLIVDVAEDLLPGAVLVRALERSLASNGDNGGGIQVRNSATEDLLEETRPRASRPPLLDYGEAITKATQTQKK